MSHGQNSATGIAGVVWDPYYRAIRIYISCFGHGSSTLNVPRNGIGTY